LISTGLFEMPIYAYRCESCGFEKDVLQKMSEAPLTQCPSCTQTGFTRQVTAAGFQLKGGGWYVTDFRNTSQGKKSDQSDSSSVTSPELPVSSTAPSSNDN
jgi:putative FmdB family regulatory protein